MSGAGGKKGSRRGPMTMREESTGKKQCNVNAKTMCKIDHLKYLAAEAPVPSLGAFFGERLAATTEALGLRGDPSFFVCERCESILEPGRNCSVRIEKNKSRARQRRKKLTPTAQNNIVYKCHFCSHRNLMRGTPKGYMKEISPPKRNPALTLKKARENLGNATTTTECRKVNPDASIHLDGQNLESTPATPLALKKDRGNLGNATTTTECRKVNPDASIPLGGQNLENTPATPLPDLPTAGLSLLDSKRRKRNRSSSKRVDAPKICSAAADSEKSILTSSKKRRKSWTSLKEIADSSGQDIGKKLTDLTIPFFI